MKDKYKYLGKNVLLFTISSFIPKILSFFLIPLYTNCLTTSEYGISDLINTTVQLLIPIFTLDIQDAIIKHSFDKNNKKKDVFSVAIMINIIGFVIIFISSIILRKYNVFNIDFNYLLFFWVLYITTAINNSIMHFCKTIDRVKELVKGTIINSLITIGLNLLLLVVFKLGINGYLLANVLGNVFSLIYVFIGAKLYNYISLKINEKLVKQMIGFSFPLIFSCLAWWVNGASDRYIITMFSGVSASGLYSIAYKIPTILSTFQNIFSQAWSISAVKEYDKNDSDGFVGNMFTLMNSSIIMLCSLLIILDIPIAKFLYAKEFFNAWIYVPPLLVSVVFNTMSIFIGGMYTATRKTKLLSITTILGAVINIILNFVLIKFIGLYGAALSTMIGYLVVYIFRLINLKKIINMKYNKKREYMTSTILVIQCLIAYWGFNSIIIQIFIFGIIVYIYRRNLKKIIETTKNLLLKKFKNKKE